MIGKTFRKYKALEGLAMHQKRGWNYQHIKYHKTIMNNHVVQSISRKEKCLHNSII